MQIIQRCHTVDGSEILHHLGWFKPYKSWDKPLLNWGFPIHRGLPPAPWLTFGALGLKASVRTIWAARERAKQQRLQDGSWELDLPWQNSTFLDRFGVCNFIDEFLRIAGAPTASQKHRHRREDGIATEHLGHQLGTSELQLTVFGVSCGVFKVPGSGKQGVPPGGIIQRGRTIQVWDCFSC